MIRSRGHVNNPKKTTNQIKYEAQRENYIKKNYSEGWWWGKGGEKNKYKKKFTF